MVSHSSNPGLYVLAANFRTETVILSSRIE